MSGTRVFWRLSAGHAVLIILTALTLALLVTRRIAREREHQWVRSVETRAPRLADLLEESDRPRLDELIRDFVQSSTEEIVVVSATGSIIADSRSDPQPAQDLLQLEEFRKVQNSVSEVTKRTDSEGVFVTHIAVALRDTSGVVAFARFSVCMDALAGDVQFVSDVALSVIIAAFAAVILGLVIASRLTQPLERVARAVDSIAEGQDPPRIGMQGNDEISGLSRSFDRMASEVSKRLSTILRDRNKLTAILGGMVEGIVAVNKEEHVIHVNAVAGRFLNVYPAGVIDQPLEEVIRIREIAEVLRDAIRDGRPAAGEVTLFPSPSRSLILEMYASPLLDGARKLIGAVVVLNDVTELRHLEEVRQVFVANVSHELKTPITAIRGLSETMLSDSEMPHDTRTRFLEKLQNQAVRLSDLVTDLLTLARLETDDGVLSSSVLDMRDLVLYSMNGVLAFADDKGVTIRSSLGPEAVMVSGDEQSLRQMTSNLLENAVKYTPPGGNVCLSLKHEGNNVIFEVKDTGVGIAAEHVARVFERFYRVDKARSREVGGTGLGLSIVKHVCLAHGGEVSLESEPEVGSTFRVRLPSA